MQRWRLRFNLQEIDLRPGRTTLGRAAECPITIEDPLVSRHHAEIHVGETGCLLVDLDSRNGVRVNGTRITAPTVLRANDRIRLGRDELVILQSAASGEYGAEPGSGRRTRPTGVQDFCNQCYSDYAHVTGTVTCPRCGDPLSGIPTPRRKETA